MIPWFSSLENREKGERATDPTPIPAPNPGYLGSDPCSKALFPQEEQRDLRSPTGVSNPLFLGFPILFSWIFQAPFPRETSQPIPRDVRGKAAGSVGRIPIPNCSSPPHIQRLPENPRAGGIPFIFPLECAFSFPNPPFPALSAHENPPHRVPGRE